MSTKVYWTELIGFDNASPDFGVGEFLSKASGDIDSVALLIYNIDFVNEYDGLEKEQKLSRGVCSYYGHAFNNDRAIQSWTNFQLKALIKELHRHNVAVLFSIFDMYTYLDEDGNVTSDGFAEKHPELCAFNSSKFEKNPSYFIMKRFADGSSYCDYFINNLARVLLDYGFDGYHLADGLSSPRYCIQSGDFSDDIVSQFAKHSKVTLPEDISGECDKNKRKHIARYNYIMENLRYEFTCFMSDWYGGFYKKLAEKLSTLGKKVIFNNAWTLDPFEALFRYGIDYRKLIHSGIDGMMLEDVGAYLSLLSAAGLGGFRLTPEERKLSHYSVFLTQLSIASHIPGVPHYNMTTLKDTFEDWNLIDTAPYEVHKMIVRRKNTRISEKGKLRKVSDGVFYCLSDDIPKDKWDKIFAWEKGAAPSELKKTMGFTAVWNPDTLYSELSEFIKNRAPATKQIFELALKKGVPIASMISVSEIDKFDGPIILANIEHYGEEELRKLSDYTAAPMLIIGKNNPISRKADLVLRDGEFAAYLYNTKVYSGERTKIGTPAKVVNTSFKDAHTGIWTAPLRYGRPSEKFFAHLCKITQRLGIFPYNTRNNECYIMAYYTGKTSATLFVNNESYGAEDFKIFFPHKIKSVKSLSKPHWYKLKFDGNFFEVHVNNRDVDIVEVEW